MHTSDYNLPTSRDDDDPSRQRQPLQHPPPLSTWIIQPPTQRYTPPRIYDYEPHQGHEMESLHINLQMDNTECLSRLKIAFGSCVMPTQTYIDPTTNIIQLACTIPSWSLTQSGDKSITLYVIVAADQPHNILDAWSVGYFTYLSRKRSSAELSFDYNMMMKRTRAANTGVSSTNEGQDTQAQQASASTYMLPTQQDYDYNYYGLAQQYLPSSSNTSANPPTTNPANSSTIPSIRSRQYYEESTSPSQLMFPYRSSTSTDSFDYGTGDPMGLSSGSIGQMTAPGVLPHGLSDPSGTGFGATSTTSLQQPPLLATTTSNPLQQRHPSLSTPTAGLEIAPLPPSSSSPHHHPQELAPAAPTTSPTTGAMPPAGANPFANLLSHADLVIEGNMESMMQDWTEQEHLDQRRLVRFWRRQHDHEIICNCQAIPPTNRVNTPQEIIVSCIYWQDKHDYFITSVDIIYLLESLIGVRFTTEEKNRVRRNLEGFRPLTVSKMKPDSGDFFKVIMAFNHPKPRNIEKDLKVFAWSSLPTALKKIISKYSASYSSTASVTLDSYTS